MPKFKAWLETDEGKQFALERNMKDNFIKDNFSAEEIDKLDEGILRLLVDLLWSLAGWNNKDWLVSQILKSGLPKVKEAFKTLLYSDKPLAERFNQMQEIDRMGSATVSEILAHFDNDNYAIWNRRAKSSLIKIGIDENELPKLSQLSGSQYEEYVKLVKDCWEKVSKSYPEITDLLKFDFLLYYISILAEEKVEEELFKVEAEEKFDHKATIEQILQLGSSLGFAVRDEERVSIGCQIDAVWRSTIANLGTITYAFEVQSQGSRDSAILNLQRISLADPTVQKVLFVAVDSEIEKIKAEISSLHKEFQDSVGYFSVKDLQEALAHQEALKRILTSTGLMKTRPMIES